MTKQKRKNLFHVGSKQLEAKPKRWFKTPTLAVFPSIPKLKLKLLLYLLRDCKSQVSWARIANPHQLESVILFRKIQPTGKPIG